MPVRVRVRVRVRARVRDAPNCHANPEQVVMLTR